jgi:phage terminase large subunit-like protein
VGRSLLAQAVDRVGGPEALIDELGPAAVAELLQTWEAVAREEQHVHPEKATTLFLCGRGWGKNFALAGATHDLVEQGYRRIALVSPTASDGRETLVLGPSGIMPWAPRHRPRPLYQPSKRKITFWNGAQAFVFSAEEPSRFRGPNFDAAVCDELAAWKRLAETYDMLQLCVRLGRPRWVIATTPRPIPIIKGMVKDQAVHVVRGSSYANKANLAPEFLAKLKRHFEGTRLGRQEVFAEILDDNPNALWRLSAIEATRVRHAPELVRIAVAIDPAVSQRPDSDETGIVVGGIGMCPCKGTPALHGFLLRSWADIAAPNVWAARAIRDYTEERADMIIGEINQGGDLVEANLRANGAGHLPFTAVHATRGSMLRAEPVASLYEQAVVHHVGNHAKLEDGLSQWNPLEDEHCPDDVAALVYLWSELLLMGTPPTYTKPKRPIMPRRI